MAKEHDRVSRFAGTLLDLLDRAEYRRIRLEDQFNPVYKLRYDAYRRDDLVPVNSQEVVRDEFDDLPNVRCYGVYIDGKLVSSVRFHHLSSEFRTSPSYTMFGDILDPILDQGHTILDPGRFTVSHEASLAYPALPFLTLRIPTIAVLYFSAKYCLNVVRPEHGAFYRRVYGSVPLSEPRPYPGLSFPVVVYACDLIPIYDDLVRRYPFFRSTEEEREQLFGPLGRSGSNEAVRPSARQAIEREVAKERSSAKVDQADSGSAVEAMFDLPTRLLATALRLEPDVLLLPDQADQVRRARPREHRQEMREIVALLTKWTEDERAALFRYRTERVPAFGDRTLESVVKSGKAELAREYLDHLSMGGFA